MNICYRQRGGGCKDGAERALKMLCCCFEDGRDETKGCRSAALEAGKGKATAAV